MKRDISIYRWGLIIISVFFFLQMPFMKMKVKAATLQPFRMEIGDNDILDYGDTIVFPKGICIVEFIDDYPNVWYYNGSKWIISHDYDTNSITAESVTLQGGPFISGVKYAVNVCSLETFPTEITISKTFPEDLTYGRYTNYNPLHVGDQLVTQRINNTYMEYYYSVTADPDIPMSDIMTEYNPDQEGVHFARGDGKENAQDDAAFFYYIGTTPVYVKSIVGRTVYLTKTPCSANSSDHSIAVETDDQIRQRMADDYQKCLSAHKGKTFSSQCGSFVFQQLKARGVITGNPNLAESSNSGKDYALLWISQGATQTSGGYKVETYPGDTPLANIANVHGGVLNNVMISYNPLKKHYPSKDGHVILLSKVENGYVYYMESGQAWNFKTGKVIASEGEMVKMTIADFEASYKGANAITVFY